MNGRSAQYLADLRNLVRELRTLADGQERLLENGYKLKSKEWYELNGSIRTRRNDADELEAWLNSSLKDK